MTTAFGNASIEHNYGDEWKKRFQYAVQVAQLVGHHLKKLFSLLEN